MSLLSPKIPAAGPAGDSPRPQSRRRWRRWLRLGVTVFGSLLLALVIVFGFSISWGAAFGATAKDARLERVRRSPHYDGLRFTNDGPALTPPQGRSQDALMDYLHGGVQRRPAQPLPRVPRDEILATLATPPASGLRITWLGHSTLLIEIDGQRLLTDPMFSERASPSTLVGTRRFQPPALAISDLSPVDAVLLSHDHYDHLDLASIRALNRRGVRFYAPLGVGAHLEHWGVPPDRIVELDWWERVSLGDLSLVATPARHFSGRWLVDANQTLWLSWALLGPAHRVFFSGDTGLTSALARIGAECGPFDVALLEVGAWHESWSDIHLGPRGAATAASMLRTHRVLPIHWATFELSTHPWFEPAETLVREGAAAGLEVLTPRLGQSIEPTQAPATPRWWRDLAALSR